MGDFEEKLNAILSSPDTMAQVMSIAQSLGLEGNDEKGSNDSSAPSPTEESFSSPDLSALAGLLPLLQSSSDPVSDPHRRLVQALEPFLQESRREKLQKALRTARLISAGKAMLSAMGDDHV